MLVPVSYGATQVAVVVTVVTKSKKVGPWQVLMTIAVHGAPGIVIVLAASMICDVSPFSNVTVTVLAGATTVTAGACCVKMKLYVPCDATYDVVDTTALREEVLDGAGLEIHISINSEQLMFLNGAVEHSVTLKVWLRLPFSSGPQSAQSPLPPYPGMASGPMSKNKATQVFIKTFCMCSVWFCMPCPRGHLSETGSSELVIIEVLDDLDIVTGWSVLVTTHSECVDPSYAHGMVDET